MDTADLVVAVLIDDRKYPIVKALNSSDRKKDIQEEEYVKISDF